MKLEPLFILISLKSSSTRNSTIQQLKQKRAATPNTAELFKGITNGDKSALGQGITLIESAQPKHYQLANTLLEQCLSVNHPSIRIGITGVPGVGKSTFIEALGNYLCKTKQKGSRTCS